MYLTNTPQNSQGHHKQECEQLSQSRGGKENMMTKCKRRTEKKTLGKN